MRNRRPAPIGRSVELLCVAVIAAICATAPFTGSFADNGATAQPVQFGIWKKRIKRLKLADPESTETMLASDAGALAPPHRTSA